MSDIARRPAARIAPNRDAPDDAVNARFRRAIAGALTADLARDIVFDRNAGQADRQDYIDRAAPLMAHVKHARMVLADECMRDRAGSPRFLAALAELEEAGPALLHVMREYSPAAVPSESEVERRAGSIVSRA